MKVLVLGGTLFLGRRLVEAALARGHEVTLFNRGLTNPGLFPGIEQLRGDRDAGDLSALAGRDWDAVIDPSARFPHWLRDSAGLLADRVEHYTFVSSCSVYADTSRPGTDESGEVHTLSDETTEDIESPEVYGALKAVCERELAELMPGRALCVRAGLIVGPHDPTGRFTYWVHRLARGGDVLAPEPREQPVQFVDVRDLGEWMLDMAEGRQTGVFNAVGPGVPLSLEELLEECRAAGGTGARLVWVDEAFLLERGVEPWSDLPLWLAAGANPELAGFLSLDGSKAVAAGLRFRAPAQTIRDTLELAETTPYAGLEAEREADLLDAWKAPA